MDTNTAGTPVSPEAAAQGNNAASPESGTADNPEFVTVEKLNEIVGTFSQRVQQQSAIIGKLQSELKRVNSAPETPAPEQGDTGDTDKAETAAGKSIQAKLDALDAKMNAYRAKSVSHAIRDALVSAGVEGGDLDVASVYLNHTIADSIGADDMGENVTVGDAPIGDFVKGWIQGDGSRFLPARNAPTGLPGRANGSASASKARIKISRREARNYTPEQLKSGEIEFVD
jgi:hypothetical protein